MLKFVFSLYPHMSWTKGALLSLSGVPGVSLPLLSILTLSSLLCSFSIQSCFHCSLLSKSSSLKLSNDLPLTSTSPSLRGQRIASSQLSPNLQYFGQSLSGGQDLTQDGLVDLAVGARGQVLLLR